MKKALIVVAVLALLLWIVSWFRTPEAVATSAAKTWPAGLGSLESVEARYPPLEANAASKQLIALGDGLLRNEAVTEYVSHEIERDELRIDPPPPLPDVTSIRNLLLRERIVWERHHVDVGDETTSSLRGTNMTIARALLANALAKARANDATAWDDLHAVWKLSRSLDGQPLMVTQTAALAMARMINAVAWKMPLPVPAWFEEVQQHDRVQPLLESFQHQAAAYWEDGSRLFPTKFLADAVEKDRGIAEQVSKETRCETMLPMNDLGVDLSFVWRRAFRYRAEREATANALRIRSGGAVETKSQCSDGAWTFDGTTLRFSREIKTAPPDRPMPLTLRVKP